MAREGVSEVSKVSPGWPYRGRRKEIVRSRSHRALQVLVHLVEEAGGREPLLVGPDQEREILGHEAGLDRVDADLLQRQRERRERGVVVELGAVGEAARPGKDRGDRVGRGVAALLVLAIMAR